MGAQFWAPFFIAMNPFGKIKVVELASVLAGPAVGMFFAELGASVVKIENKNTGGDVTRKWKLPEEDAAKKDSAYYRSVNWGKKSLLVDLKNPKDLSKVLSLIKEADIVISNYKHGDDKKLGLDYIKLKKINPRLIYGHISGYGYNDDRIAYDAVLQAETGYMSMNGTKESGSLKMPVALIDVLAAHHLKEGVLCALIERQQTGKGQFVGISLYDAAISSLTNQASNYLVAGHIAKKTGSLHPNIAPYGETFITKDGREIVLAIGSDQQFINLCESLEIIKIINDKKYINNKQRIKNRKSLYIILSKSIARLTSLQISRKLNLKKVPYGFIRSIDEVLEGRQAAKLVLAGKSAVKSCLFN